MDPTSRFFSRLRKLAVTLESETSRLQQAFESRKEEPDSGEWDTPLVQQKAHENEVDSFIQACRTMEQKVSRDVQTLKAHWEEYGYQAPTSKDCSLLTAQEAEDEGPEEGEAEPAEREGGGQEEDGENLSSSPPAAPTFSDVMRTPQLSDFGLSEMQLKRTLAGAEWCSEVPPMPEMNLPHPALSTPAPPLLPLTPKRALRMEDEELQTPQMHDFGISEDNDFTTKLLQKNAEEPHRWKAQLLHGNISDLHGPSLFLFVLLQTNSEPDLVLWPSADILASPELPVLCTPGLKIRKTNGRSSSSEPDSGEPESPPGPNLPSTPQVPAFQTPYMTRLVSTKKVRRAATRPPCGDEVLLPDTNSHQRFYLLLCQGNGGVMLWPAYVNLSVRKDTRTKWLYFGSDAAYKWIHGFVLFFSLYLIIIIFHSK
uniref:Uncharacterized protein n=1 Tax=Acanthochromis polyacanthus TaxID=80966 RepID=A0A3Q1GHB0_9TELE